MKTTHNQQQADLPQSPPQGDRTPLPPLKDNTSRRSSYRWVMISLCLLAILGQTFSWLAPAPMLSAIIADLSIDLGQAGSLLTVLTLLAGMFAFAGSYIVDKLGAKMAMTVGLLAFGAGGVASYWADSYIAIFSARVFVGLGYGICAPIAGVIIATWFGPKEQQYVNALVIVFANLGFLLAFLFAFPIYESLGSWQNTLTVLGAYSLVIMIIWIAFAKSHPENVQSPKAEPEQINERTQKTESGMLQAARRKEVWLLALMLFGVQWTFNTFTTYLAIFFQEVRGMEFAAASATVGYFPLAGIIGGLFCGIASARIGLRKPFTWPLFVLMILGVVGSVMIPSGPLLYLSVAFVGFGAAGFFPICMQIAMELKGATPEMVGGALAIIIGISFSLSYFSPLVFGLVVPKLGLSYTFLAFGSSLVISAIAGLIIRETGWRNAARPDEA